MMQTTAAPTQPNSLTRYLPILNWLPNYDRAGLSVDFLAGLTIMVLLVPEGTAYAQGQAMTLEQAVAYALEY